MQWFSLASFQYQGASQPFKKNMIRTLRSQSNQMKSMNIQITLKYLRKFRIFTIATAYFHIFYLPSIVKIRHATPSSLIENTRHYSYYNIFYGSAQFRVCVGVHFRAHLGLRHCFRQSSYIFVIFRVCLRFCINQASKYVLFLVRKYEQHKVSNRSMYTTRRTLLRLFLLFHFIIITAFVVIHQQL